MTEFTGSTSAQNNASVIQPLAASSHRLKLLEQKLHRVAINGMRGVNITECWWLIHRFTVLNFGRQ